jgi:hypothetical protein
MATGSRWRVEGFQDEVWLVERRSGAVWEDTPLGGEAMPARAAADRVNDWFPEGWGEEAPVPQLLSICRALSDPFPTSAPPSTKWLKSLVRQALRDGRLAAVRVTIPAPAGAIGEEKEEQAAAKPAPRQETTWIEIVLMDDDDPPKAVPFKRYRIELPNGAVREGMLDGNGSARLVGIDAGTCLVSFPDFDASHWRRA